MSNQKEVLDEVRRIAGEPVMRHSQDTVVLSAGGHQVEAKTIPEAAAALLRQCSEACS